MEEGGLPGNPDLRRRRGEGGRMRLRDPICGKPITAEDGTLHTEYKRRKYFFCSEKCKASFEREAERIHLHELLRVGALLSSGKVRWGLA